jgi:hypothetical protein
MMMTDAVYRYVVSFGFDEGAKRVWVDANKKEAIEHFCEQGVW